MYLLQNFDNIVLNFITQNIQNPFFDKLMPTITALGNGGVFWILIGIILILNKKTYNYGILLFLGLIACIIIGEGILKNLAQRPRPCFSIPNLKMLIPKPSSYSFPSGHTISSFVSAGILYNMSKKYGIAAFILALSIAFSRIYLNVHYPTDIIGGIIIGLTCSKLITFLYQKYLQRFPQELN